MNEDPQMDVIEVVSPVEILLVEDDPGDTLLTTEALQESKVTHNLHCVVDGEDALAFLRRRGPYVDAPRPDLVLLDLNLPRVGGHEVLAAVKDDPELKRIPVVILTTSRNEQDVVCSYNLQANAYVPKPVDFERMREAVQKIDAFYFTIVRLPHNHRHQRS